MDLIVKFLIICSIVSSVCTTRGPKTIPIPCVYKDGQTVCYCFKERNKTFVDCSSRGLSQIPEINFKFKSLNFKNNSLTQITRKLFDSIKYKENTRLVFSDNRIRKIEPSSFEAFKQLGFLDLSYNPLTNSALKDSLINLPKNIQSLSLASLHLYEFEDTVFEPLKYTKLQQLDLQYNKFNTVHTKNLFKFLPHLRVLNFSNNYVKDFEFTPSQSLLMLRLTRNDITEVPSFCNGSKPIFPNLKILYLDKNCIFHIIQDNVSCLKKLEKLNISQTNMHYLPDNVFSNFTSLKLVSLEYSSSLEYIHPLAFKSDSLEKIYIRNNGLYFSQHYLDPETLFANTPNLTHLDISGNILGKMSYYQWKQMLKVARNLQYLDISEAELEFLPLAIPDHLHELNDLRAGFNGIKRIKSNYFRPLPKIKKLYLNGNKIARINEGDLPENLTVLNLSYNPYTCDCRLLWFLNYLKEHQDIVRYYPYLYNCSSGIPLADFKITVKSCLLSQSTSKIVKAVCSTLLVLIVIGSLIYHFRWRLRYFIHILSFHRRKCVNINAEMFLHDVYVACADKSMEARYILENLVSKLENEGKRVFFPVRDGAPNKPTVGHTLEQMDSSKFILICVSDAFASDQLCEFQAHMAMERSVYSQERVVIVIILEKLTPICVNKTIDQLLRSYPDYFLWSEEEEANTLFWKKLGKYFESE